jgi:hypothetical protein
MKEHRVFALFVASFQVSKEIMFRGKEGGRSAGRDANLIIDVLDVVVYGLLGDDEKASYLLFGVTTRNQSQYFHLALAQSCH